MFRHLLIIFLILLVTSNFAQTSALLFDEAMMAYNVGQYAQSNRLFEKIFNEYKITDELYSTAKYFASESLLKLGRKEEAAIGFEYLVKSFHWSNYRDKALYNLGIIYYSSQKFELSRKNLKSLLEEYPESSFYGNGLYWIGESYFSENKLDEAIKFFNEAVNDKRNKKFVDYAIYSLANAYEKVGDYNKAVTSYDQLLTYHRNSTLATYAQIRIGICYFKLKDYQSSIIELKNPVLVSLSDDLYSESIYLLAASYYRVGEYDEAEKSFVEVINKFPVSKYSRDAKYGLAWTYFQLKEYDAAYSRFDELVSVSDSIGIKSFFWKGECKRYLGKNEEAKIIYEEFINRYPDDPLAKEAQYLLGIVYFGSRNTELATRFLISANASDDENLKGKSFAMLGEIELDKGKYKEAINYYEIALANSKHGTENRKRSLLGLGISYYYLKNYNKSLDYFAELEESDPDFENQKVNYFYAENYFSAQKFDQALNRFDYAYGSDEKINMLVLYGKAYSYFNSGDYENAAYQFSDYFKKYPSDKRVTDVKLRLADSYFGSKNYNAAAKVYKELFSDDIKNSGNPYARYQYAQALYKSGKSNEAIQQFESIPQDFPISEFAEVSMFTVGWIYFQNRDYTSSIVKYRNLLERYPTTNLQPIIYYSIGDAQFNMEKYDSAIVNYEKVLSQFPSSLYVFDAVNGIQLCYVAKGNPEKAVAFLSGFVSQNPTLSYSDQLFFKKGEIYYGLGQYLKARQEYQSFISSFPQSSLVSDAYYWIGKSYKNLGQEDEAIQNFKIVFKNYKNSEQASSSVLEIGNIYNEQKKFDLAVQIYNEGISDLNKSGRLPEFLFNKGVTLLDMNKFQEGYSVFEEVIFHYPQSVFADQSKLELSLIDIAAKRYSVADGYLSELSEKRTDELGARSQFYLGQSLFDQGRYTEAITSLVRVRTIYSRYEEWLVKSYLLLGDSYVKLDDKRNAAEMYRAVLAKYSGTPYGDEALKKLRKIQ